MLDVHPPHHAADGWRDFFIHIATIVIGLLIAVGLEQTVEYLHHRHELNDTREQLKQEFEQNKVQMLARTVEFQRMNARLQGNLADLLYLRQHPGTLMAQLPTKMNWNGTRAPMLESAWNAAKQNNVTQRMSTEELHQYESLYAWMDTAQERFERFREALNAARYFTVVDFDASHLTQAQLDKEIELTQAAIYQHYYYGMGLWSVHVNFSEMPSPTKDEMDAIVHENAKDGTSMGEDQLYILHNFALPKNATEPK